LGFSRPIFIKKNFNEGAASSHKWRGFRLNFMKDLVLRLIPEILAISNKELQEKVIACWIEAIEFRGWTEELLRSIPFTLLA
jgi:hypothetical protein